MHTEYTDQESERVRRTEQSSAGKRTQQLTPPSLDETPAEASPMYPVSKPPRTNNPHGLALIIIGICILISRFLPGQDEIIAGMILLTIASCFLFFSLWKRVYGLLIPGCILGGLSIGVTFADLTNGASVLWGLALSFGAIFVVGQGLFAQRNQWPIYPAVILFAIGSIVAIANASTLLSGVLIWLPIALIAAGFYFGIYRHRVN